MTVRSDLIPVVDAARQVVADMGLRVRSVVVVNVAGISGTGMDATESLGTPTTITPTPRVRGTADRRAYQPGIYEEGDLIVDKISASYTESQLLPTASSRWLINGSDHYAVVGMEPGSFGWRVHLRRMKRQ